ncbi:hypothetical protein [Cupriavidus basilensis]|uniref:hypothetical protein n=1 Tax=Cupriavidus basilensis TaxID=68895 RepID=UPI00075161E9|nr:hypothetical protein [Cupriavidus basilensis]
MQTINLVANAIIFLGSFWALYTQKVPTRTGGAVVLALLSLGALGNMSAPQACHSGPEIGLNVAVAMGVLWAFWRLELRHLMKRGHA